MLDTFAAAWRTRLRAMGLRSYLALLTAGAMVPLAVFAVVVSVSLMEHDRDTFRRGAQERTLAVMTAVDAEIRGSIATAQALATRPSLDSDDLESFRRAALRVLEIQPSWANISLALPSGQQVVNLLRPHGAPLPSIAGLDDSLDRVLQTGQPAVGDLVMGPVTGQWDMAVRVPVVRDGQLKYVLSAVVKPEAFSALLRAQSLPEHWVGVVLDQDDRIVARTVNPEASVGQLASQSLRDALARSSSGWFRGSTIEGAAVYTPFQRSGITGWAFAMGIPAQAVESPQMQAAWTLALGLFVALCLAVVLARFIGQRIAKPLAALASAAGAMGRGEPADVPETRHVAELQALAAVLRTAGQAINERQELLQREKQALQASDRAKDEFIAMLSHELRNPLAALVTGTHVLKLTKSASDQERIQEAIERQARHMAGLIDELLDMSSVSMGKATLQPETFDLAAAAENSVTAWRAAGRFEHHHVSLETSPAWVHADRARVEQILNNLLDNALKFTPAGGPVRMSVRQSGDNAVLVVSDGGQGLAPELLERVFDLFFQGAQGPDRARGGLGIGLALVKRLAQLHGGTVVAHSGGPGRGATFAVHLPAAAPLPRQPVAHVVVPPAAPGRVLIVEDNNDARELINIALTLDGHEVHEAPDGETGLALAAELRPDVALVDIGLPGIDGYEVARRLRSAAAEPRIVLIALTGYGQSEDQARALEAGFDAHLSKPVLPELLKRMLAEACARRPNKGSAFPQPVRRTFM